MDEYSKCFYVSERVGIGSGGERLSLATTSSIFNCSHLEIEI